MPNLKLIDNNKKQYDDVNKVLIPQSVKFEISGMSKDILNSLRRIIISEIPIIAVDPSSIKFEINTCSLHDQILEKRVSQIPLNLKPSNYRELVFILHNPEDRDLPIENNEDINLNITTADIRVYDNGKLIPNGNIFQEDYLITQLKYKQKLKFEFKAELNNVKNGSKRFEEGTLVPKFLSIWQAGIASYRFKSNKNELVDDEKMYIGHENKEAKEFIFIIENFGSDYFTCHYMFAEAIKILIEKLERTKIALKNNGEPEFLRLIDANNFYFIDEGFTLGNVIIDGIINVQKSFGESLENYCAGKTEHPLKKTFIIKVILDKNKIKLNEKEIMILAIDRQVKILQDFQKQWKDFKL